MRYTRQSNWFHEIAIACPRPLPTPDVYARLFEERSEPEVGATLRLIYIVYS